MITWEHIGPKGFCCLFTPAIQLILTHVLILPAAEGSDGAGQWTFYLVRARFTYREVSPQGREEHLHQSGVLKHLLGGAVQAAQFSNKCCFRQRMNWCAR